MPFRSRFRSAAVGAVERLVFGKALVFHFCELQDAFKMADIIARRHPAYKVLRDLGFYVAGTGLLVNEMKLTDDKGASLGVGRFIIPIAR